MPDVGFFGKLKAARTVLSNWPLLILDRAHIGQTHTYHCRTGHRVICRSRTTDINEVVAIMSGLEYPTRLLKLGPGAAVLDIGAHIGSFALLVDHLNPGTYYRGVAVEPSSQNLNLLERNLTRNAIANFEVVRAAIPDTTGVARLDTPSDPDAFRLNNGGSEEVATLSLASLCESRAIRTIDLMKLDVEGAEYQIVRSELSLIGTRVRTLLIEYHPDLGRESSAWITSRLSQYFTSSECMGIQRLASLPVFPRMRRAPATPTRDANTSESLFLLAVRP
jgi:FkbM family methyltransferase